MQSKWLEGHKPLSGAHDFLLMARLTFTIQFIKLVYESIHSELMICLLLL